MIQGYWKNTVTIHFDRLIFPVCAIPTLQFKISVSAKPIKAQARQGKKGIVMARTIKGIEIITATNMVNPTENATKVRSLVEFKVYSTFESSLKKRLFSYEEKITECFPSTDLLTISEDLVKKALSDKAEDFLAIRKDYLEMVAKVAETGISSEEWGNLAPVDKINIELIAHQNVRTINLTESTLKDAGINFTGIKKIAENYLLNGNCQGAYNVLRPLIHNLLGGQDGQYFYGVKIRKSGITEKSVIGFLSSLVRDAAFLTKYDKKDKKRVVTGYDYSIAGNKTKIVKAVTGFMAVILHNETAEVIKPQPEEAPQPVQTETVEKSVEKPVKKSTRKSTKKSEKVA